MRLPRAVTKHVEKNCKIFESYSKKLSELYRNCYTSTLASAVKELSDGSLFVLTGDIPAMWLRDSAAQVNHYVRLAEDKEVAEIIKKVILKQFQYIVTDPYANAFNESANGRGHTTDRPYQIPWVWERKYEVDSLCYPIKLLYRYWKRTHDNSIIENELPVVMRTIVNVWKTEQYHDEMSSYNFIRHIGDSKLQKNNTLCGSVKYTGMTWSGFRPSDDSCTFGYLIPSNMFASVVLKYAAEMLGECELSKEILELKQQITDGIEKYGTFEHEKYGKVYSCEVDGFGNRMVMDDANIPSLISAPYLGYLTAEDEIYRNTRRMLLSRDNPYYFEGKFAKGIGSPHTEQNFIWHLALSMQGLTSNDKGEMSQILDMLINTDADTGFMHESFNPNNPKEFTRPWFTWSNSLFCEFAEKCLEESIVQ